MTPLFVLLILAFMFLSGYNVVLREENAELKRIAAAVDPDTDVFATLVAREWSIRCTAPDTWHVGSPLHAEAGSSLPDAWKRACAVYAARNSA